LISREALSDAKNQVPLAPIYTILGIVVGIIVGYVGIPYFKKRRSQTESAETAT